MHSLRAKKDPRARKNTFEILPVCILRASHDSWFCNAGRSEGGFSHACLYRVICSQISNVNIENSNCRR